LITIVCLIGRQIKALFERFAILAFGVGVPPKTIDFGGAMGLRKFLYEIPASQ